MGGMISVVIRKKDGQTHSFKTSTGFLNDKLNNVNAIREEWLINFLHENNLLKDEESDTVEHESYNSSKAVKAPYDYGIVVFDYLGKHILSSNRYSPMIRSNSSSLLEEYWLALKNDFQFKMSYREDGVEKVKIYTILEAKYQRIESIHFLLNAVVEKADIYFKRKKLAYDGSIESVLEKIYKLPSKLVGKTKEKQIEFLDDLHAKKYLEYINNKDSFSMNLDGYNDICYQFNDFSIIETNDNNIKDILDYMINNKFFITEYEKDVWVDYVIANKE